MIYFTVLTLQMYIFSDEYRRQIWPLLVGVTEEEMTEPPSLDDLSKHSEYHQVR